MLIRFCQKKKKFAYKMIQNSYKNCSMWWKYKIYVLMARTICNDDAIRKLQVMIIWKLFEFQSERNTEPLHCTAVVETNSGIIVNQTYISVRKAIMSIEAIKCRCTNDDRTLRSLSYPNHPSKFSSGGDVVSLHNLKED